MYGVCVLCGFVCVFECLCVCELFVCAQVSNMRVCQCVLCVFVSMGGVFLMCVHVRAWCVSLVFVCGVLLLFFALLCQVCVLLCVVYVCVVFVCVSVL